MQRLVDAAMVIVTVIVPPLAPQFFPEILHKRFLVGRIQIVLFQADDEANIGFWLHPCYKRAAKPSN
jgi:hypothetical protein